MKRECLALVLQENPSIQRRRRVETHVPGTDASYCHLKGKGTSMLEPSKTLAIGESVLKHGLTAEYIEAMWYDSSCDGFEVRRLPPKETNVIVIRLLPCPEGILEMIAEDELDRYFVFHAQIVPEGKSSTLVAEALELYGFFT